MRTREVPGDDLADDTQRLVDGVRDLVLGRLDGVALDLVRPAGVVADGADRSLDIRFPRPAKRLAVIERLEGSELVRVRLNELRELVEELAALEAGAIETPDGVERLLRNLDGDVDVLGGSLGHLGDDFAVGRVDHTGEQK